MYYADKDNHTDKSDCTALDCTAKDPNVHVLAMINEGQKIN